MTTMKRIALRYDYETRAVINKDTIIKWYRGSSNSTDFWGKENTAQCSKGMKLKKMNIVILLL